MLPISRGSNQHYLGVQDCVVRNSNDPSRWLLALYTRLQGILTSGIWSFHGRTEREEFRRVSLP